jgi:hypothetical protein
MEPNKIALIALISLFSCVIIGIIIYIIIIETKDKNNNPNKPNKCLNGCTYNGPSGNCGKYPCKKNKCPYTCSNLKIGEKGWCQYDIYEDGNPSLDCTGCGCK